MESEMNSIRANGTWDLVKLPENRKALPCKWVFRLKQMSDSSDPRYKARVVAKGFRQEHGVDFDEIFSPVVKLSTLRFLLVVVAHEDMELLQLDVKTALLHSDLEEEIDMEQLQGFASIGREHLVCRLRKSLYGLKQAPRQWYRTFDDFVRSIGFLRSDEDHCLYVKDAPNGTPVFLILYVDDMLLFGRHNGELAELRRQMLLKFAMKDLGPAHHILRMKISGNCHSRQLCLSQSDYIRRILERFSMHTARSAMTPLPANLRLSRKDCPTPGPEGDHMKSVPYAPAVGLLMYAMVAMRPDIAYAVDIVSRFMHNPGRPH
jgi:ATP-binding cassette subfamily B (MDR/TAP) protein 1